LPWYFWRRSNAALPVDPTKKPTTVSSRGFLSKVALSATRPSGVVFYDDYEVNYNLQRDPIHGAKNKTWQRNGQARIPIARFI